MPEVHKHGFSWEKSLLCGVYGAQEGELKGLGYTCKTDLPGALNRLEPGVGVSIKTAGLSNAVCMGDCLRVFDAVSSAAAAHDKLHMTLVHYEQDDAAGVKKLAAVTEVDLTGSAAALFGDVSRTELEALDRAVKAVPQKRSPTAEEHAAMYTLRDALLPRCRAIHLDIKCNSQQSRLQCSFSRAAFQRFLAENPERVVARSSTAEFRGGRIVEEVTSGRRVFNSKKAAAATAV
jgi:hypothetical protein